MHPLAPIYCIVFHGRRRIAAGTLAEAVRSSCEQLADRVAEVQVFDAETSSPSTWTGAATPTTSSRGWCRPDRPAFARPAATRRRRA